MQKITTPAEYMTRFGDVKPEKSLDAFALPRHLMDGFDPLHPSGAFTFCPPPMGSVPPDFEAPKPLPTVVGVYAPCRHSGKTTFVGMVKEALERAGRTVVVVSFADPLRLLSERAMMAMGYSAEFARTAVTGLKDTPIPLKHPFNSECDTTFVGRDILNAVGEGVRDLVDPDAWATAFEKSVRDLNLPADAFVLCDDMRRENEKAVIEDDLNGLTVYMQRGPTPPATFEGVDGLLQNEVFDFEFVFPQDGGIPTMQVEANTVAEVLLND